MKTLIVNTDKNTLNLYISKGLWKLSEGVKISKCSSSLTGIIKGEARNTQGIFIPVNFKISGYYDQNYSK